MTVTATLGRVTAGGRCRVGGGGSMTTTATFTVDAGGDVVRRGDAGGAGGDSGGVRRRGGDGADVGVATDTDGISYTVDAEPPYAPGQTGGGDGDVGRDGVGWPEDAAGGVDGDVERRRRR